MSTEPVNEGTTIRDLRTHLFDTIRRLKDPDKPMDLDRARAVAEVAQTIINSAKVEVDFVKATGQRPASEFLPASPVANPPAALPAKSPENGTPGETGTKVKCNQCQGMIDTRYLAEHKRTKHPSAQAAAAHG